jgi:hypothetical protein
MGEYDNKSPSKMNILVADDEAVMIGSIRIGLESIGYLVFESFSAPEGLGSPQPCRISLENPLRHNYFHVYDHSLEAFSRSVFFDFFSVIRQRGFFDEYRQFIIG